MDITRFALDRRAVTWVLLIVLAFAGLSSYNGMPKAEDPGFLIRTAVVMTQFPGASPERVEQLVTDKLEEAIQEMPELDAIKSTSKGGVSIISVDLRESYTELQPIWDRLRRKVERVTPELPQGIIGPTVDDEFGDVFGTIVTLTGDGFTLAELEDVGEQVRDELLLIPEAAKVEIYGTQEERVFVEYENARLADLGISPGLLQGALQARNIINPGGELRTDYEKVVVEPTGNFESVEDIRDTLISLPRGGTPVYLRDIADVRRGVVDPARSYTRVNGERALAIAISMREGGNILTLGQQIRATVERLRADLPIGIDLEIPIEQSVIVDKKVSDFAGNLIQSVAIVMAVMLFTLGVRTGLVVASLIPMAILAAFVVMPFTNTGIDQMSLAALIIALGLLVDNAIVISESILVAMQEGKTAVRAALDSANELRTSLLISSLTTAAAFLPIYLAESAVGEYTGALFKVVTITLLSSWVLALTMIPLFCVLFLKVDAKSSENSENEGGEAETESFDGRWYALYRSVLLWSLRNRVVSLGLVVAAFVGSFVVFGWVPKIFFPDNDRPTFTVSFELPVGTPLRATEKVVASAEQFMVANLMADVDAGTDGVLDFTTFIGDSAPMFVLGFTSSQVSPETASMVVNTTTLEAALAAIERLQTFCADIPGLQATIEPLSSGPGGGKPIEVRISGRDTETIFGLVAGVQEQLRGIAGTLNVADDWGARSKKYVVTVDEPRAQRAGVTHQDVATSMQTSFSGLEVTRYREENDSIPVVLRSKQVANGDRETDGIGSLNVFAQSSGRSVPIAQVVDIDLAFQPAKILRRDRLRTVTVQADLVPDVTATEVNSQIAPYLEEASAGWPLGYSWEFGGEDESSSEANASIGDKLPIAGMAIILLLVWQFNSIRKPLIILLTIPLSLIGVFLGLFVMNSYFGFMTLLGVISLAGIVINNAIVLIDRIQIEIDENGLEPAAAVVEAAQRRLRPILLTTMTTLGGMIPLYLGGGPMFEPMAVTIMFGLLFATILTLGFVPLLYSIFFRVNFDAVS